MRESETTASLRLFALGTLKRGFAISDALNGSRYLGQYRSVERFPLLIAGPWYAPMLLNQPGLGRHIAGELYELDDAILARIDPIESIGRAGNLRIQILVAPSSGGPACDALAYAKEPALATPVHSGYLADYQDRRFIPPWQRKAD
jgi:gamma-glutamylaminecyclotransferase